MFQQVHGEIYEVDSNVLSEWDELEGHPTWYKRTKCEIITPTAGAPGVQAADVVSCFAYFLTDFTKKFLSHKFLSEYTQDYHKMYVEPSERHCNIKAQSQDK